MSGDDRGSLVARISISVPIFTGGVTQSEIRAAAFAREATRQQAADTRSRMRTSVMQAWSQMMSLRTSVREIGIQREAARKSLRGISAERKVGQRTVFEEISAEQAVLAAETTLEQSKRALYLATCQVAQLTGRLDLSAIATAEARTRQVPDTKAATARTRDERRSSN